MKIYLEDDRKSWEFINKLISPKNLSKLEIFFEKRANGLIKEKFHVQVSNSGNICFFAYTKGLAQDVADEAFSSEFYQSIIGKEFFDGLAFRQAEKFLLMEDYVVEYFPIWFYVFLVNWYRILTASKVFGIELKDQSNLYVDVLKSVINHYVSYFGISPWIRPDEMCKLTIVLSRNGAVRLGSLDPETNCIQTLLKKIPSADYGLKETPAVVTLH